MKIMDITNRRETYTVELSYSLLWETALGIAAFTYYEIRDSLSQDSEYWTQIEKKLSKDVLKEIQYVAEHHTWFSLLQLLHVNHFSSVDEFLTFVRSMDDHELRFFCLPYLGIHHEETRKKASLGEKEAFHELINVCTDHKFYPSYILFISKVNVDSLKEHVIKVFLGWHQAVVEPCETQLREMLRRDYEEKQRLIQQYTSEEFVELVTDGMKYKPEPFIERVLLIPQYIYRPWNIHLTLPGVRVIYYPIADQFISINNHHPYRPPSDLVHVLKALGDENRLRIMKLLREKSRSLHELTGILSLSKSSIHHHLSLLRAARLVKVESNIYKINLRKIYHLDQKILDYMGEEKMGDL